MLMDDDGDMAECCLTEKKRKMEASLLEKRIGESSNDSFESLDMNKFGTEELEMLLEAQFASIGSSINKLTMLMEYIKDTEGFINIELNNVQNQLLKLELLLGSAAFVVATFAVVPGVFWMNFEGVKLYKVPHGFEETLVITGVCSLVMLGCFAWYLKRRMIF